MTNDKLKTNLKKLGFKFLPIESADIAIKGNFKVYINSVSHIVVHKEMRQSFTFWYEFMRFYNKHNH
jgi:hypothetical protein